MRNGKFALLAHAVLFALTVIIVPLETSATSPVPVVPTSVAFDVKCVGDLKRAARLKINDDPSFTLTVDDEHFGYGYRSPEPFEKGGYLRFTYLSDGTTFQFHSWESLKCHAIVHYDALRSGSGPPVPTSTLRSTRTSIPTRTPRPTPISKPLLTFIRPTKVRGGPGSNYQALVTVVPGKDYVILVETRSETGGRSTTTDVLYGFTVR